MGLMIYSSVACYFFCFAYGMIENHILFLATVFIVVIFEF